MEYEIKDGKLIIEIASINGKAKEIQPKINYGFKSEHIDNDMNRELPESIKEQLIKSKSGFICDAEEDSKEYKKYIELKEKYKDKESINPNRFNTGQLKITMSTEDKQDFGQISDIENGIYGYDRIRIFDSMGRKSDKVHLINDGPGTMYVLLNRTGVSDDSGIWTQSEKIKDKSEIEFEIGWKSSEDNMKDSWSAEEIMIYPGEKWSFFDVYEMRVRSPTQGNLYRVTEDDVVGNTIRQVM